jgi:hypothetical protein
MPMSDFAKRLMGHAALAFAALFFVLIGLEKLIPGFVTPLLDLPQLGLGVLALVLAGAVMNLAAISRWRGFASSIVFFGILFACIFFLATRVLELSSRGYGLLAAAILVGLVGYHTLWHDRRIE